MAKLQIYDLDEYKRWMKPAEATLSALEGIGIMETTTGAALKLSRLQNLLVKVYYMESASLTSATLSYP